MRKLRPGLLLAIIPTLFGQGALSYKELRPEQAALVKRWGAEYEKIVNRPVDAEKAFNHLSLSARTTFDAITHALLSTKLTDQNGGKPLGTAFDLVDMVESVNGQVAGARGDHQFRLYVKLKPDALRKLYASKEFMRTSDNTVFHIGYPINFRLLGGDPSIQFSVVRTGRRADIDVDYRSSHGPKALVNGHLTSANSDVRAGKNYFGHTHRWNGLSEWWLALFHQKSPAPEQLPEQLAELEAQAADKKSPPAVEDAVHDFFQTWLVDRNATEAVKYFSIRSFACISEYEHGSTVDTPLVRVRILQHMAETNKLLGDISSLAKAVRPAKLDAPNSQPVKYNRTGEFGLESLRDDAAAGLDCRSRFRVELAERLERPQGNYNDDYAASVQLAYPDGRTQFLTQVWRKEEGTWKILAWSLEDPFKHHPEALPRIVPKSEWKAGKDAAPVDLAGASNRFLETWLLKRDFVSAAQYFAPESRPCLIPMQRDHSAKAVGDWLRFVAEEAGKGSSLSQLVGPVEHGHEGLIDLKHPNAPAYIIASMSDDLGLMNACPSDGTPRRVAETPVAFKPLFQAGYYMTAFQLKSSLAHGAIFKFIWTRRGNDWQIVSYYAVLD